MIFVPEHIDFSFHIGHIPFSGTEPDGDRLFPGGIVEFAVNGDFFAGGKFIHHAFVCDLAGSAVAFKSGGDRSPEFGTDEFQPFQSLRIFFDQFFRLVELFVDLSDHFRIVNIVPDLSLRGDHPFGTDGGLNDIAADLRQPDLFAAVKDLPDDGGSGAVHEFVVFIKEFVNIC